MNTTELQALRRDKDEFFRVSAYSPLTPEQQARFDGLRYYDPDPALTLIVEVEPFGSDEREIAIATTTGGYQTYRRHGRFAFEVDGQTVQLTIYAGEHGYFLPFVDASAGTDTYPAGRYLEPDPLGGGRFRVDFNAAYNPYCAYNDAWSCPITPRENHLPVAVRAGEKLPTGAWLTA